MESLDIVPGISQRLQWTSGQGSSHIRLGSVKPLSKSFIPGGEPAAEPDSLMLLKAKPIEPVSFYPCISPSANNHMDIGFRRRDGDSSCVCRRIEVQTVLLTSDRGEKQVVYQFCSVSAFA
jgi:hypothetical protein